MQERTAERASLLADVQRDLERLQRAKAEQTLAIEQQTAELATLKEQHADRIAALEAELSKVRWLLLCGLWAITGLTVLSTRFWLHIATWQRRAVST